MLHISQLLHDNTVHLDVPCATREELLAFIASFFSQQTAFSKELIYKHLLQREAMGSTALGYSVAIPHTRVKGLNVAQTIFVRTQAPIDYEAPDGEPVSLFFALLVPENATDIHLEILSEIAQLLASKDLREYLLHTTSSDSILKTLRSWPSHHDPLSMQHA